MLWLAILYSSLLLAFSGPSLSDISTGYESALSSGDYTKALAELNKRIRFPGNSSKSELADVYFEKARFYEKFVGDYEESLAQIENILGLGEIEQEKLARAKAEAARLKKLEGAGQDLMAKGDAYLANGENRLALRAFESALDLKPAMYFKYPVLEKLEEARSRWHDSLARALIYGTLGALLLVFVPLFYLSRPWRNFGRRELISIVIIATLWTVSFELFVYWTGANVDESLVADATVVKAGRLAGVAGVVDILYYYGLIGIACGIIIVSGMRLLKKNWIRTTLNSVCCLLLFVALSGVFFFKHLGDVEMVGRDGSSMIDKHFKYVISNPKSHVLSDPLSFPGMDPEKLDEEDAKQFLKRHYESPVARKGE